MSSRPRQSSLTRSVSRLAQIARCISLSSAAIAFAKLTRRHYLDHRGPERRIRRGCIRLFGRRRSAELAALYAPTDILVQSDGTIFVSDLGNHVVRKITQDGRISTIAGNGEKGYSGSGIEATSSSLAYPGGLALNSSGELLIADGAWTPFLDGTPERGNQCVRKLSQDGTLEDLVGRCNSVSSCFSSETCGDGGPAASAILGFINGLAVDSEDRILIADYTNGRIRRVRPVHEANQNDLTYVLGPNQKEVFVFGLDGRHWKPAMPVRRQFR